MGQCVCPWQIHWTDGKIFLGILTEELGKRRTCTRLQSVSHFSLKIAQEGNGSFLMCTRAQCSDNLRGCYWLVQSKSSHFLNGYCGKMKMMGSQMLSNSCFLFVFNQKAVPMANVVTQIKKLKEGRVQRTVSVAELQKKKAFLEKVSLSNHHQSNILVMNSIPLVNDLFFWSCKS